MAGKAMSLRTKPAIAAFPNQCYLQLCSKYLSSYAQVRGVPTSSRKLLFPADRDPYRVHNWPQARDQLAMGYPPPTRTFTKQPLPSGLRVHVEEWMGRLKEPEDPDICCKTVSS